MLGPAGAWNQGVANQAQGQISQVIMTGAYTLAQILGNTPAGIPGAQLFSTTLNAWFDWNGTRWYPRKMDPRIGFLMFDDFTGVDRIGWLDWQNNAGTQTFQPGNPQNPGIWQLRASTSFCNIRSSTNWALLGQAEYYIESLVQFTVNPTAADDQVYAWGFHDNVANDINSAAVDGVVISLNRAINNSSLVCATYNNSASSVLLTSSVITCGSTFYRLGILVSQINSTAVFYLNGANIATINTNIPNGPGRFTGLQWMSQKTAGSGNADFQTDYFDGWVFTPGGRSS